MSRFLFKALKGNFIGILFLTAAIVTTISFDKYHADASQMSFKFSPSGKAVYSIKRARLNNFSPQEIISLFKTATLSKSHL